LIDVNLFCVSAMLAAGSGQNCPQLNLITSLWGH